MNDLIHDINRLQKVVDRISKNIPLDSIWNHNVVSALNDLKGLISEKQKQLTDFEIDNMSYEQYEEHMKGRGFND